MVAYNIMNTKVRGKYLIITPYMKPCSYINISSINSFNYRNIEPRSLKSSFRTPILDSKPT